MASHGADANEASNFPSAIPELLKILPKRETTLQIRMGNPVALSQNLASNNNNSRHHNHNNSNHHRNHHNNNNNNNSTNSSSTSNSHHGPCYHTLRYDFKPASINSEEPASLELTQNGQVTIKAPNVGGSISSQTVFRGQRRPHVKECLLVIDNITGEMVLQKLTDNITVKATRSLGGGGERANTGAGGGSSSNGGGTSSNGAGGADREKDREKDRDRDRDRDRDIRQGATPVLQPLPLQIAGGGNSSSGGGGGNSPIHNHHSSTSINNLPISKNDGPQLSEDSSSSDDSSSDSSSSSSSSSSSNSGNSSPNNEGFTF